MKKMKKNKEKLIRRLLLFSIYLFITESSALAQGFDAGSMAMGGAYGAVARGVDALAWNPASLALSRIHPVELNFIGLNLAVANSSFSLNNYNRYFTLSGNPDTTWTDKEKATIFGLIPNRGLQTSADVHANVMGLAILSYGISAEVIGNALGRVPKSTAALALYGNQKDQYAVNGIEANGFSALKIGLSVAQKIPFKQYFDELGAGIAFNYYLGIAVAETQEAEGAAYTGTDYIYMYSKIRGRRAVGLGARFDVFHGVEVSSDNLFVGKGFGMDLGTAGIINQKFRFSLVFKNLFASINWNSGTTEYFYTVPKDSFQLDAHIEHFHPQTMDTSYSIGSFRTSLPVLMHMGVAYQLKENLLLSLDLEQAFANRMGYSDQARMAVGTEYRPLGFLPLRAGLSFGGKWGGYSVGLGFGLHSYVVEFDFAYLMQHALWPTYADGVSTALNLKFLF